MRYNKFHWKPFAPVSAATDTLVLDDKAAATDHLQDRDVAKDARAGDKADEMDAKTRNLEMTRLSRALSKAPQAVHDRLARLQSEAGMSFGQAKSHILKDWIADRSWQMLCEKETVEKEERRVKLRKHRWLMASQLEKEFPKFFVENIKPLACLRRALPDPLRSYRQFTKNKKR